jgi:pyruvate ferredoxin oxidoreductase delta subunit
MKITADPGSTIKNKTGGWRTFIPKTDMNTCISCGNCARVCPESAVSMINKEVKIQPETDYDFCKGCGLCAAECPVKAIKMELESK